MEIARSRMSIPAADLLPVLTSTILILATMAFVVIPLSMGAHPGETITVVGNLVYHAS
jgi:hypothetical protein